ncbi:MAG: hypothetical protein V3T98_02370 [Candidatus Paceibacterota bacterium]
MDEIKINWFTKIFLKFWPKLIMKRLAKKMGINNPLFDQAHEVFSQTNRIDILPLKSGHRGFMIVIDRKTALYFYQDGDHFIYDGFEMGKYNEGDVTIFDNIK